MCEIEHEFKEMSVTISVCMRVYVSVDIQGVFVNVWKMSENFFDTLHSKIWENSGAFCRARRELSNALSFCQIAIENVRKKLSTLHGRHLLKSEISWNLGVENGWFWHILASIFIKYCMSKSVEHACLSGIFISSLVKHIKHSQIFHISYQGNKILLKTTTKFVNNARAETNYLIKIGVK